MGTAPKVWHATRAAQLIELSEASLAAGNAELAALYREAARFRMECAREAMANALLGLMGFGVFVVMVTLPWWWPS